MPRAESVIGCMYSCADCRERGGEGGSAGRAACPHTREEEGLFLFLLDALEAARGPGANGTKGPLARPEAGRTLATGIKRFLLPG